MKYITRDTINAIYNGSVGQKRELRKLGFQDDHLESSKTLYDALYECPHCDIMKMNSEALEKEKEQLRCNREYFDKKFAEIKDN